MPGPRNLVVAQCGEATPALGSSLRGIIEAAREYEALGIVYAARHGLDGVLREELLDLSVQDFEEVTRLRHTPVVGAMGTGRSPFTSEQAMDAERWFEVLQAHDIGFFLCLGGQEALNAAQRIAQLAHEHGRDLVVVGVPTTIANEVGDRQGKLLDHSPGYGSVAKYWTHVVQYANEENQGSCRTNPVLVLQATGDTTGFVAAAARLADPWREMPLQIYLAEEPCPLPQLADQVNEQLRRSGRCVVVVREGLRAVSSSQATVAQTVVDYLNQVGLVAQGVARGMGSGADLRHAMAYASTVDLDEAYRVGQKAVELAAGGQDGVLATIGREPGPIYGVRYDQVPLSEVARSERRFPREWIPPNGCDVSDDYLRYVRPLVGEDMISVPVVDGRPRWARFEPVYAKQKLPRYAVASGL